MPLSIKALDRLVARVIDRVAQTVPPPSLQNLPIGIEDIDAALDRAAGKLAEERFGAYLDSGSFDHRVNDTIDAEVSKNLDGRDLLGEAKDRLDSIVEDKLDAAGFERKIERAIEYLDLDEIANSKMDEIDFEGIAKDAVNEAVEREADFEGLAKEAIELALAKRYDCTTVQAAERAAVEVISTAICRLEDAVNTKLEQEVQS